MGPANAAKMFRSQYFDGVDSYTVILYGSLAATGKGHMTDVAIESELKPKKVTFIWKPNETLMFHVNGMTIKAMKGETEMGQETYYSVGGGAIIVDSELTKIKGPYKKTFQKVYNYSTMNALLRWCRKTGYKLSDFVYQSEGEDIRSYLSEVWQTMKHCVETGLQARGVLAGGLNLPRKAHDMYRAAQRSSAQMSVGFFSPSHTAQRVPLRLYARGGGKQRGRRDGGDGAHLWRLRYRAGSPLLPTAPHGCDRRRGHHRRPRGRRRHW